MLKQIIVIEDNARLVEFVKDFLVSHGDFQVKGFLNGTDALQSIRLNKPDLVIVDLELTDLRGETITVEVRKMYPDLPIIILTGDKTQSSLINSLNSGADDYITKPFNADELLARIHARLRSSGHSAQTNQLLSCDDLVMDLDSLEVRRGDHKIELTAKEFELLKYMLLNQSRILTRDKILNAVWGYSAMVDTRVVDVHIGKLRKKLKACSECQPLLSSIRGFGYKLAAKA